MHSETNPNNFIANWYLCFSYTLWDWDCVNWFVLLSILYWLATFIVLEVSSWREYNAIMQRLFLIPVTVSFYTQQLVRMNCTKWLCLSFCHGITLAWGQPHPFICSIACKLQVTWAVTDTHEHVEVNWCSALYRTGWRSWTTVVVDQFLSLSHEGASGSTLILVCIWRY